MSSFPSAGPGRGAGRWRWRWRRRLLPPGSRGAPVPDRSSRRSPPPDRGPRSAGGTGGSRRAFGNPRGAAGVSSPGAATRPGPAPAPRSAVAPPARERGWVPAKAFCLFAEAASNFLSKLLIRYTVLSWCFAQGNESGRLEGLVTQGVVIGELRITSALLVQLGCTCDS